MGILQPRVPHCSEHEPASAAKASKASLDGGRGNKSGPRCVWSADAFHVHSAFGELFISSQGIYSWTSLGMWPSQNYENNAKWAALSPANALHGRVHYKKLWSRVKFIHKVPCKQKVISEGFTLAGMSSDNRNFIYIHIHILEQYIIKKVKRNEVLSPEKLTDAYLPNKTCLVI